MFTNEFSGTYSIHYIGCIDDYKKKIIQTEWQWFLRVCVFSIENKLNCLKSLTERIAVFGFTFVVFLSSPHHCRHWHFVAFAQISSSFELVSLVQFRAPESAVVVFVAGAAIVAVVVPGFEKKWWLEPFGRKTTILQNVLRLTIPLDIQLPFPLLPRIHHALQWNPAIPIVFHFPLAIEFPAMICSSYSHPLAVWLNLQCLHAFSSQQVYRTNWPNV